jgi:hypothetical protein
VIVLLGIVFLGVSLTPGDGIEGCTGNESPFRLINNKPILAAEVPNGRKYVYGTLLLKLRLRWSIVLRGICEGYGLPDG